MKERIEAPPPANAPPANAPLVVEEEITPLPTPEPGNPQGLRLDMTTGLPPKITVVSPMKKLHKPLTPTEISGFKQLSSLEDLRGLLDESRTASEGVDYKTVSSATMKQAMRDPDFLRGDHVLLVKRARDLPGFQQQLSGTQMLTQQKFPKQLLKKYKDKISVRRYNTRDRWKVIEQFLYKCFIS